MPNREYLRFPDLSCQGLWMGERHRLLGRLRGRMLGLAGFVVVVVLFGLCNNNRIIN
jgi:hypothetical protein